MAAGGSTAVGVRCTMRCRHMAWRGAIAARTFVSLQERASNEIFYVHASHPRSLNEWAQRPDSLVWPLQCCAAPHHTATRPQALR